MEAPNKHRLRLRLLVAYDGGAFQGWQSQPSGNTVQDALEKAITTLTGEHACVHGSGRTDSGVHALGQIAHVDVPSDRLPLHAWDSALNGHLPRAVRILNVRKAAPGFHARFSATGKIYAYRVCNTRSLHPLEFGRAWHVPSPISRPLLKEAAERLTGCHDFAAFAANRGKPDENTVRTIHRISIRETSGVLTLRFEGDGFLYRMVRLLTGTMIRLAQGKQTVEWLESFLLNPQAARTSYCAPAEGLFLVRVLYTPRNLSKAPSGA
jgi:tRNA pseudouridine38-40 synthase